VAAGVPTVWLEVVEEMARRGARPQALRHIVCGGARPPAALTARLRRDFGIPLLQAWGMTETSPLATVAWPKHHMTGYDDERLIDEVASQAGLPLPTVDVAIREEDGTGDVDWDGETMGRLLVRGPYVVDSYLRREGAECFEDGWFVTGDVAVGLPNGYFHIADRTKDLIKSGGEWISSVDMESALMALPDVAEAAVIAIPDPKWQERPLACVAVRDGVSFDEESAREHLLAAGFAKWQLPDRFEVVAAIPRTSVGKFDKKVLRRKFASEGTS
jgi:fatty-acyl-CoA synthase